MRFSLLDGAIGDVLRRGITKNMARGDHRRDVADFATDDNGQFRLKISPVLRKGNFNFPAIGQQRSRGLEPKERLLREFPAHLADVIGVIQTDGDDFAGHNRHEGLETFARGRLPGKGRRAENIALHTEDFAVHDFGVEDILTLAKPSDGSHKRV